MNPPDRLSVLFIRLSTGRDTAASSTHRVLADIVLSAAPGAAIDFAFLPPKRAPRVSGLFSGKEWSAFDLILVTNSFVQEAINLPWLLHANGVPPWAPDRPESFPPLLLGGSNAFAAQCLARPDGTGVPDAFFFGEAEDVLPAFIRSWATASGAKRERLAAAAAGLDGFWITGAVPAVPVRQAVARGNVPPPTPQPLPDVETAGTARLSVGAGCAAFCSFCFEGYERKPYRELPLADALEQARRLKAACGARTVELDAYNLNTYAGLAPLVEQCARLFDAVAFKSQRADGIAACPPIVDLERAAGKSSFTLGIEGVSARMRAFLCKSLSDDEIAAACQALLGRRVRELKLFYILTAHETAEDLAAFGDFCSRLRAWLGAPGACTRVVLSFGRLVRMPNTPLAYDRLFLDEADWRFCVDGVSAACRRNRLECRFAFEWPDYLATQLLAACGHAHAEAVVRLAVGGLSFHAPWREQEAQLLFSALGGPPRPAGAASAAFPFVQRAVLPAFVRERWESARQFLDAGYCLGDACSGCGACAGADERRALTSHARALTIPPAAIEAVARLEAEKRRLVPLFRAARLPAEFAGRSPEWTAARLMQHLLTRHPELTDTLLAADEALFALGENAGRLAIPSGRTVVRLRAWECAPLLAALAQEPELFPDEAIPADFAPGAFASATWILPSSLPPRDAAQMASAWLNDQRLPHTLRRDDETWRAEFAPAAAKKKCVFSLSVVPCDSPVSPPSSISSEGRVSAGAGTLLSPSTSAGSVLTVTFAPKADLRALLARLPSRAGHPRATCQEIRF